MIPPKKKKSTRLPSSPRYPWVNYSNLHSSTHLKAGWSRTSDVSVASVISSFNRATSTALSRIRAPQLTANQWMRLRQELNETSSNKISCHSHFPSVQPPFMHELVTVNMFFFCNVNYCSETFNL